VTTEEKNGVSAKRIGPLKTVGQVLSEMGRVYREARRKEIGTADAGRFMAMLTAIRQAVEGDDVDRRLAALEQRNNPGGAEN